jgi:hypothetical protein
VTLTSGSPRVLFADGLLLCGRGQPVTPALLDRLANWSERAKLVGLIPVHPQA